MIDLKKLKDVAKGLSLLYVEDDDSLRFQTEAIFENLFKHVDIAKDGEMGFSLYEEYLDKNGSPYDVVITDIQMPKLGGIELSRKILEINKEQKIIIISAYDKKEYEEIIVELGIFAFMQKPLDTDQIFESLTSICLSVK